MWRASTRRSARSQRVCPSCTQHFRSFLFTYGERRLIFDLCMLCQFIWVERGNAASAGEPKRGRPSRAATSRKAITKATGISNGEQRRIEEHVT